MAGVLVAEDAWHRQPGRLHQPVDCMQVRGADARAGDPHERLIRPRRLRVRPLDQLERLVVLA
jgi:hypothetical protein